MASLAGAALAIGCSLQLDVDDPQCRTDDDCSQRGFASAICQEQVCVAKPVPTDPIWGCVGQPKAAPTAEYEVVLPFIDVLSREPVVGAEVSICSDRDLDCAVPLLGPQVTGQDGITRFKVPASFSGYAKIKSATYFDTLFYIDPPSSDGANPVTLISPEVFNSIAQAQKINRQDGTGIVFATAFTCENKRAAGMQFFSDPPAPVTFYFEGPLPSISIDRTDVEGRGGLVNLQAPGLVTVTSVVPETSLETTRHRLIVRPDTITVYVARP